MVKLSVIILCHHGDRWIGPCMQSLEDQSLDRDQFEIILADNGGTTPSLKKYKGRSSVTILVIKENVGFAAGNNRALAYARGEIVFLLNQDVVLHTHCLTNLLKAYEQQPAAGFISANMQMVHTTNRIDLCGPLPQLAGIYRITRTGYALYELQPAVRALLPTQFVSGNALCFKRSILISINDRLFDERLISYTEDLDLSLRAAAASIQMFVCPNAVIYHFRDDAFSGRPAVMIRKFLHVSSNRLFVYYQNLKPALFLKRLPLLIIGIPLKIGRSNGESSTSLIRLAAGCALLPLVFYRFALKVFQNKRRPPAS